MKRARARDKNESTDGDKQTIWSKKAIGPRDWAGGRANDKAEEELDEKETGGGEGGGRRLTVNGKRKYACKWNGNVLTQIKRDITRLNSYGNYVYFMCLSDGMPFYHTHCCACAEQTHSAIEAAQCMHTHTRPVKWKIIRLDDRNVMRTGRMYEMLPHFDKLPLANARSQVGRSLSLGRPLPFGLGIGVHGL